jgi:16S rRNA processing protein RimM
MAVSIRSRSDARACLLCFALLIASLLRVAPVLVDGYTPGAARLGGVARTTTAMWCASSFPRDVSLNAMSGGEAQTTSSTSSPRRRRRKNKYADLSKVETLEMDPLEKLVAESVEKNRQLLEEEEQRRKRWRTTTRNGGGATTHTQGDDMDSPATLTSMNFPDNKDIDPYDPTTFGYVTLGTIASAHGVHGWVKVAASEADPSSLSPLAQPGMTLHVKLPRKRAPRAVRLVAGRHCVADEYLCLLDGSYTRDDALKLRGATLYTTRQEDDDARRQSTSSDGESYFVSELVGLTVYAYDETSSTPTELNNEVLIGTVGGVVFGDDISDLPLGYDMLEIIVNRELTLDRKSKPEERVLIPLVPQLVPLIDSARGVVMIDPPPGLLDLRYVREEKVRIKGLLPPSSSSASPA